MIEFAQVTKRYGRKGAAPDALCDVSLAIPAGSVWAVVGPNGAGKSTLLSLLLGFVRPSAGRVALNDEPPRQYLREHGAAYLPERFQVPASWRVRDALRLFGGLAGAGSGDAGKPIAADVAAGAARDWGLEEHFDRRTGDLSRGLLQRLGLAQALLTPRALVVLDEPTEGLDPVWRIRLRDALSRLRAEGRTIIIASHDLAEVERVADHAVLLEQGRVRQVMNVQGDVDQALFDITLDSPLDDVATAFPTAEPLDAASFRVRVAGAGELSERLAALLAMGAVVSAVRPVRAQLEDRVRAALEPDA